MNGTIKYSRSAIDDLDRIEADVFHASNSEEIPNRYIDELLTKIESRADFPRSSASLYYEGLFTGYYYVVFKAYIAFYRLEGNVLFVDRILLGKSDYLKTLGLASASENDFQ